MLFDLEPTDKDDVFTVSGRGAWLQCIATAVRHALRRTDTFGLPSRVCKGDR